MLQHSWYMKKETKLLTANAGISCHFQWCKGLQQPESWWLSVLSLLNNTYRNKGRNWRILQDDVQQIKFWVNKQLIHWE